VGGADCEAGAGWPSPRVASATGSDEVRVVEGGAAAGAPPPAPINAKPTPAWAGAPPAVLLNPPSAPAVPALPPAVVDSWLAGLQAKVAATAAVGGEEEGGGGGEEWRVRAGAPSASRPSGSLSSGGGAWPGV
jgi:hypothetical protein